MLEKWQIDYSHHRLAERIVFSGGDANLRQEHLRLQQRLKIILTKECGRIFCCISLQRQGFYQNWDSYFAATLCHSVTNKIKNKNSIFIQIIIGAIGCSIYTNTLNLAADTSLFHTAVCIQGSCANSLHPVWKFQMRRGENFTPALIGLWR